MNGLLNYMIINQMIIFENIAFIMQTVPFSSYYIIRFVKFYAIDFIT